MSYSINKTEARLMARADLTIFNETQALMKQVITDAGNGLYETNVTDGTTMTESTPDIIVTGSVANPTITGTPDVIIDGVTVTLGTSGTNLNAVIADINDASITGVVASKNASDNLVLTFTCSQTTTWTFVIGTGTANTDLGLTAATNTATNPTSVDYFNVWEGNTADRPKTDQMNQVVLYFQNLGYTIQRIKNTSTNKTFKWAISY
ncbi:MAG: hypothetical protein CMQ75_05075 [Gammaproteobacteria bacterium]|nr:hypothetical protein [Gammaproteobacteria bacterium]|tara:strand:+ start:7632 stop:8252 length:621 start_codon:yes stop_codon:yes gene_type:complete